MEEAQILRTKAKKDDEGVVQEQENLSANAANCESVLAATLSNVLAGSVAPLVDDAIQLEPSTNFLHKTASHHRQTKSDSLAGEPSRPASPELNAINSDESQPNSIKA